jgi:hypothetical protein
MHTRSALVSLTIPLPAADYRVFRSAARRLKRILGQQAPDVPALIQFNLRGQDVRGLTDYYLDRLGVPVAAGRSVTLRARRQRGGLVRKSVPRRPSPSAIPQLSKAPADPTRN